MTLVLVLQVIDSEHLMKQLCFFLFFFFFLVTRETVLLWQWPSAIHDF